MGKYIDFIVDYNDNAEILGSKIIENITCNRLKAKKPCIVFVTGDSGEGKSYAAIKILEIINKHYGVDTIAMLDKQVVYTPLEYTKKLDYILFDKEGKAIRVILVDEAREVIRAALWHTFINQAVADCNAMSRRIKALVIIIISQFIKDIDSTVRRTITYYCKANRPLSGRTQFEIYKVWKDDSDIEKPKLRKRKIKGFVVRDKKYSMVIPSFEVKIPDEKIIELYESQNYQAKSKLIRKKLENLMQILEKEIGHEFDKVKSLVDFYLKKPDLLRMILERKGSKLKLKKDFKYNHALTNIEVVEFENLIKEKLAELKLGEAPENE